MKSKTLRAIGKTRNVHLIDIENLCCESNPTLEHVKQAKNAYFDKVQPGQNDLFFVTVSSKSNLEAAMFGWRQDRAQLTEHWQRRSSYRLPVQFRKTQDLRLNSPVMKHYLHQREGASSL